MKTVILCISFFIMTSVAGPVIYIGKIVSRDMDPETLRKINEVFVDVWSEKTVFKNIDNLPEKNVSEYVQKMNINDSDKIVTGTIMELGAERLLRIDVYNANGTREHVSREKLTALAQIYNPMISTRQGYYAPIEETSSKIKGSSRHQMGWSITIGAGIKPEGYDYQLEEGAEPIDPPSLALIDIAIIDAIGRYHDHQISLLMHFNMRADMAIALGYSKAFMPKYPHSLTSGFEVGLNKMIIDRYMGIKRENLLGQNDGLTVTPKVGVLLFRDQKINLFADVAYTWIISGRKAHYPSIRFGVLSYWGKRFNNTGR